jgi:TRAP-type C4-dicarboxylate transport system substrate-binding protein
MKKLGLILLLVTLVVSTLIAGCTSKTTSTTSIQPPTSSTSSPVTKTYELKFGSHIPGQGPFYETMKQWAEKIEGATNGQVKITFYMGGSLVSGDFAASCAAGICDITLDPYMYEETWKLQKVVSLPELHFPGGVIGSKALAQLHQQFPILNKSYAGVYPMYFNVGLPITGLHTKVPVRVPQDIKDMKMATTSEQEQDILLGAGAVPLVMPSPDWYMSVDRNLVKGILGPFVVTYSLGLHDLLTHHLKLNFGPAGAGATFINLKIWDSFSPDIKQAFKECNDWYIEQSAINDIQQSEFIYQSILKAGGSIPELTEAEIEQWNALTLPLSQEWIKDNKSYGPTEEIFQYVKDMLQQPEFQPK